MGARLDLSAALEAKKFANIVELKGPSAPLRKKNGRPSTDLTNATNQIHDYTEWLAKVPENSKRLAALGWDVWTPAKHIVMGSRSEFVDPGEFEKLRQNWLNTHGTYIHTIEDILGLATKAWRSSVGINTARPLESLSGHSPFGSSFWPLVTSFDGLAGFLLAGIKLEDARTDYGNVDVRGQIPSGLVHLEWPRLQPLARKLNIPYANALVDFNRFRRGGSKTFGAVFAGIVIADYDKEVLVQAHEVREVRNQPVRKRKHEREVEAQKTRVTVLASAIKSMFSLLPPEIADKIARHATEPKSGRVGDQPHLRIEEAAWLATAAYAAYEHLSLTFEEAQYTNDVRECLKSWGGPDPKTVLGKAFRS